MDTILTFDKILNAEVPSEYIGLPLLDIAFKRADKIDWAKYNYKSYPYPYISLAYQDDSFCIVFTEYEEWIGLCESHPYAKLYISTYCKIYFADCAANMDVIGTLLREYLECYDIHACTYPGQGYYDEFDYYDVGISGSQMIGRIRIKDLDDYHYVLYNLIDHSARLISLTEAQYMKLVYLQMKANGMKSTMIENKGIIGSLSEEGICFPLDTDICFISDNCEEMSYTMFAINQDGKWGFIDSKNKIIVSPQYDYAQNGARLIEIKRENIACARVMIDDKFGLVDLNGILFVECVYDSIGDRESGLVFINGMALVCKDNNYGFINKKGELVVDCIYGLEDFYFSKSTTYFNESGTVILSLNGKTVFVDKSGNIVKSGSRFYRAGDNWSLYDNGHELVNEAGKTVLKFNEKIDYLSPFEGDVARARIGKKWGVLNLQGETILPFIFERIRRQHNNLAPAKINGKWGIINFAGQWIVSPDYDSMCIHVDYIEATLESNSFYFNLAGESIIEPSIREKAREFSDGLVIAEINSKYGFKDGYGNWIINPQYEEAYDFNHGWALVSLNGIRKRIDKSGKTHSREGLSKAYSDTEDYSSLFGFINDSDSWIIKPSYEDVGYFYEGLAKVKLSGKWGFIDKDGNWVVEPKYEDVGNFHNGMVSVILNDECHWINSNGELVR